LLDPVLMVREDLDEVAHRRSPGDQAEDLRVSLEDRGALDGLAGDALVSTTSPWRPAWSIQVSSSASSAPAAP